LSLEERGVFDEEGDSGRKFEEIFLYFPLALVLGIDEV
jgi:hypothetical protein